MKKSKIAALVGSIIFTALAVLGILMIMMAFMTTSTQDMLSMMNIEGLTNQELIVSVSIAYGLFFLLTLLNWIGFARLNKSKKWSRYFLAIGIFYVFASMINGAGLIVTLPVAICFILVFVFKKKEDKNSVSTDKN